MPVKKLYVIVFEQLNWFQGVLASSSDIFCSHSAIFGECPENTLEYADFDDIENY